MRAAVVLLLALSACATNRAYTYPAHRAPDMVVVETSSGSYKVIKHRTDPTILIIPPAMRSFGAALASDLTLGGMNAGIGSGIKPQYMEAAERYAKPRGCEVVDLYQVNTAAWEARLDCR